VSRSIIPMALGRVGGLLGVEGDLAEVADDLRVASP
jgi:hypothetical protein